MSEALIDNDILFKTVRYNLAKELLACKPYGVSTFHILNAAKYMLLKKFNKKPPSRGSEAVIAEFDALLHDLLILEPTEEEIKLASELEYAASQLNEELDGGESQLCAILQLRGLDYLFTGDKRAITAIGALLANNQLSIAGKVICLEQLITQLIKSQPFDDVRNLVCQEQDTDTTLKNCFSCKSPSTTIENCLDGLNSYISNIKQQAPTALNES